MSELVNATTAIRQRPVEQLFSYFLRMIAGYCLLFGILYWIRLIGVYDGTLWRFDLMPVHWQIASVTLAVMFPFAAIGLWMLTSWGPVIWFICAATETTMYVAYSDLYGRRLLIVVAHILVALIYIVFRAILWWQRRKAGQHG